MTRDELRQIAADVQRRQSELANVEVKAGRGETLRRLHESLSAFINRTGGGVLLFGLDESSDFSIVSVGDAQRLQEDITHLVSSDMEPALRPPFLIDALADETVVALEIDEIPAAQKPCFYKPTGLPIGACLRVGNTNRQMTEYEVFGYLSGCGQPTYDEEVITAATIKDLDGRLLDEYLARLRQTHPGAGFLDGERDEALARLHVIARDGEIMQPPLAGLLRFGKYPQEFLPQLMITFVQYYGTTPEEKTPQGARRMDSRRFEGPIPEMIMQAETYVLELCGRQCLSTGYFGARFRSTREKPCVKHLLTSLRIAITARMCGKLHPDPHVCQPVRGPESWWSVRQRHDRELGGRALDTERALDANDGGYARC